VGKGLRKSVRIVQGEQTYEAELAAQIPAATQEAHKRKTRSDVGKPRKKKNPSHGEENQVSIVMSFGHRTVAEPAIFYAYSLVQTLRSCSFCFPLSTTYS
jgi:hypothetical protein